MHLRTLGAQRAQAVGQHAGVHGVVDIADAQPALVTAAQAARHGFQARGMDQEGAGFGQEGTAVAGEADALQAALEQGQSQLFLELGDLPAQRRLRDVQALGSAPHVFFLGHGDEVLQLANIEHVRPNRT